MDYFVSENSKNVIFIKNENKNFIAWTNGHTVASTILGFISRLTAHKYFSEHFNYCPVVLLHSFSVVCPVREKKYQVDNFAECIFTTLPLFSGFTAIFFNLLAFIYKIRVQWIFKAIWWCNRHLITFTNIMRVSYRYDLSITLKLLKLSEFAWCDFIIFCRLVCFSTW